MGHAGQKTLIAAFDIGTTDVKGLLLDQNGQIQGEQSSPLHTVTKNGVMEQNPEDWWESITSIAATWWKQGISPKQVAAVTFSGQMQDVISLDRHGHPIRPAILYGDSRATGEAETIRERCGALSDVTGNPLDGTMPVAKWLWLKKHQPDIEAATTQLLFGAKDYIIYRLTGKFVTDPTNASTTALMSIKDRTWQKAWLEKLDLAADKLPDIISADETVGPISAEAARYTGFNSGTPVFCGLGDAGATTAGAGVLSEGDHYFYLGTTGWVAGVTHTLAPVEEGLFQLAYLDPTTYIAIAPLLNAGNVHYWGVQQLAGGNFADFEKMAAASHPGANDILFLPYLNGERSPINDPQATGAFVGLNSQTTTSDLTRAVLEGVTFSLRQVVDRLNQDDPTAAIRLIGGGTKSESWCQIIADICGKTVIVPKNAQYLPSLGAAAAPFIKLGWYNSYEVFTEQILNHGTSQVYEPNAYLTDFYAQQYQTFLKIYPALTDIH